MRTRNIFITVYDACAPFERILFYRNGTTDIDSWPAINEYTLAHPCMLHTAADLSYVASKLTVAPWCEGYDKLKNSGYSMRDMFLRRRRYWGTYGPGELGQQVSEWWNNYTYFYKDAAAAYQLALR